MRTHYIINTETWKFTETDREDFDGDWPARYPHLEGCSWVDAPSIWEHEMVNGIPYSSDLCRDGLLATMYADVTRHSEEDIKAACARFRRERDVVSLRVRRITPA